LHLGAALAGGDPTDSHEAHADRLSTYGLAVGEAFQLRDDLLGAFGDPRATGKATGDDFRDGKQTLLIVLARAWLDAGHGDARAAALLDRLGSSDLDEQEVGELQDLLDACGARTKLEQRIAELTEIAHAALPTLGVSDRAEAALARLADQAAWRCR
jgi:geranylgeranyl diphosphate synthase type I